MKSISESKSIESSRESIIKKGYVKIFFLGISLLIVGFVLSSLMTMIPRISYGEPWYEEFMYLMRIISSLSRLFLQIGIVLFSLSSFIGALADRTLSDNVKRGMVIASGIALLALVIIMIFPSFYYY